MKRSRSVRKYNSGMVRDTKPKVKIPWVKIGLFLSLLFVVAYSVFAFLSFRSIKAKDLLREQGGHYYLLSNNKDDFKKTLIVFENRRNDQDYIERIYVYGENMQKQQTVLVYVPSWISYGGLEEDFGNAVPVSSFKYAGDFLQQGKGVEYTVWQMEQMLGMNFDEYIWFTPTSLQAVEKNLGDISGDTLYSQYYQNGRSASQDSLFLNSFVSHLNWARLVLSANKFKNSDAVIYSSHSNIMGVFVKLKQIQSNVFSTKPALLDLSVGDSVLRKESENSGGLMNYLNIPKFDQYWRESTNKMLDRELEQERVRVEIYNGSGIPGAASMFARKIQNAGCEVVRFDNAPDTIDNTKFYIPKLSLYPKSLASISELFPGQYELVESRPSFMTTGDIVIVLGKDISRMYSF